MCVYSLYGVWVCIGTLMGVFGAITSTAIQFVLPPVFYLKLGPEPFKEDKKKWVCVAVLVLGSICGLTSFGVVVSTTYFN